VALGLLGLVYIFSGETGDCRMQVAVEEEAEITAAAQERQHEGQPTEAKKVAAKQMDQKVLPPPPPPSSPPPPLPPDTHPGSTRGIDSYLRLW
jgi:hypothetical protein